MTPRTMNGDDQTRLGNWLDMNGFASMSAQDAFEALTAYKAAKAHPTPSPVLSELRERIAEVAAEYGAHEGIERILAILDEVKAGEGK